MQVRSKLYNQIISFDYFSDSEAAASEGFEVGLPYFDEITCFELLRTWLEECVSYHSDHKISALVESGPATKNLEGQSMRESDEETELPTRVLAVGSLEAPSLYLHCPQKDEGGKWPKGKYIALSHCWGEEKLPLRTTKDKLDTYKGRIEPSELPRTFLDAVTVAREIDVQYLWIDSLCIIQDDSEDWAKESQKMEQVFSSAYCTISATSAKNSHEGFLSFPVKEAVRIPDGEKSEFAVYACIADKSFKQAVDKDGLLNTRGWVLQERALSRRTIHFTGSQIFWECGSVIHYDNLSQLAR
jgi:Heterokaryon incompatibility protein (HET)